MVRKSGRAANNPVSIVNQYVYNEDYIRELIEEDNTYEPYPTLHPSEKAQLESDHENDASIFTVEKILDKKKEGRRVYYMVKWEGFSEDQATWEPLSNLQNVKELLKEFDRQYELGNMSNNSHSTSISMSNNSNIINSINNQEISALYQQSHNMESFSKDHIEFICPKSAGTENIQYAQNQGSLISQSSKSIKKGWLKRNSKTLIDQNQNCRENLASPVKVSCNKNDNLAIGGIRQSSRHQQQMSKKIIEEADEQMSILLKQKELIAVQQVQIEEQLLVLESIKSFNLQRQKEQIERPDQVQGLQQQQVSQINEQKLSKTPKKLKKKQILSPVKTTIKPPGKRPGRRKKNVIETETFQDHTEPLDGTYGVNSEDIKDIIDNEELQPYLSYPQQGSFATDIPLRIKGAKLLGSQMILTVEWQERENGEKPLELEIDNTQAKELCPKILAEFYESKIHSSKVSQFNQ
eukprot:403370879